MNPISRPLCWLLLGVPLLACDGSELEPVGPPQGIESLGGANQVGTVGQPLPDPIRVRVIDSSERGVADVAVVFRVEGGDVDAAPAMAGIASGGSLAQGADTLLTDGLGEAGVEWTLGPVAGPQTMTVVVTGVDSLEVTAEADPGPPAQLVVAAGDGQIGEPGSMLDAPFEVAVLDEFGNGVGGRDVSWMVSSGGGSLAAATSQTDQTGIAPTTLTLGPGIGFNTVTATHGGLAAIEIDALGLSFVSPDPPGDTLIMGDPGESPAPDLLAFGAAWTADSLLIALSFRDSVTSVAVGGAGVVAGLVQFDIDLDAGTGIEAEADKHRESGTVTGMGVDVTVDLFRDENGEFLVFDANPEVYPIDIQSDSAVGDQVVRVVDDVQRAPLAVAQILRPADRQRRLVLRPERHDRFAARVRAEGGDPARQDTLRLESDDRRRVRRLDPGGDGG